jgi:hypothetical protein
MRILWAVTLDRYGHLFPDELQQLAERLQAAYADAITDPARTEAAETMLRERKRSRLVTCSCWWT